MHAISDLKKQQVGFRMPTYLLNEVDEVVSKYEINRSEFLNEAAKDYLQAIKKQEVYSRLGEASVIPQKTTILK
ncbi:ribbon-helix-helix domain-containing protein [Isorropodon fossajaponicum symbiont]|uniref:ribbon-helix-helix domain-containing protein n=1 Tax=Isorropodon fossajaponicum symbiont TaxID=883811 RepID=UPI001915D0D8|nr:ribbon-helix-helix domain-containing protein [Isorropodon fossajaponicum symbiont]